MVMPLGRKEVLEQNDVLGRVLLMGLVSGTEMYFRTVLARLIGICPICRSNASSLTLSLAAADYYGVENLGFGLLDNISFAAKGEVLRATKKLTGFEWEPRRSSVGTAIDEFEKLSHLRHAAIHARGELNPHNLGALGLKKQSRTQLAIKFYNLQHAAEVCLNAVRAYDRFLFHQVTQRWIAHRKLTGNWKDDKDLFCRLLSLFRSKEESRGGPRFVKHIYISLQPCIAGAAKARTVNVTANTPSMVP